MESKALNIVLGILSALSFIWSYISKENRTIAIIIGFLLILFIFISEKNIKLQNLEENQKRLEEKLKIHEQLIDIKKDIELLKEKRLKNNER